MLPTYAPSRPRLQIASLTALAAAAALVAPTATAEPIIAPGDPIIGGQLVGEQFEVGVVGTTGGLNNWPAAEPPEDLIDGLIGGGGQKYLNFAEFNTGVIITPSAGPSTVTAITMWVANDAVARDPTSYELYGTNEAIGGAGPFPLAAFTPISGGDVALPPDRDTVEDGDGFSAVVTFANEEAFRSYLLIFPTVVDEAAANSMQLSEVQFDGVIVDPRVLLEEDFAGGDGGFVETTDGATPVPFIYNAGAGTWSTAGDPSGPSNSYLTGPELTLISDERIRISFDHRYSIEGDNWDAGALQVSFNGGPFEVVPAGAFGQNGYSNTAPLRGNHTLSGGDGFSAESPGYGAGEFITSSADLAGRAIGDTLTVRFLGSWDDAVNGVGNPNWEIDSVTVMMLGDGDGDGMPDEYEDLNGLDKTVDDAALDPDGDGLANIDEFLGETDPQDPDTDGDTLLDGVETRTGVFVDATNTGTDPTRTDSDGDRLADNVETGTGLFVDASDTGTDPNDPDTDGDGIPDGIEVERGSSPLDENDVPELWVVRSATSSIPLNNVAGTRALFGGTGVIEETTTINATINFEDNNVVGVFPGGVGFPVHGGVLADHNDFGILVNGTIGITVPGIYTFGFNSDDGGGIWIDDEPVAVFDANRGSATSLGAVFLSFGNHRLEFLYWERGGSAQVELFAHNEVGDFTAAGTDNATIVANYHLLETSVIVGDDTDGDGLADAWEINFFGNLDQGAADDPDDDGLDNAGELAAGTDPNEADSDGDGLKDGAETGTGTFVDATNTGTDPLKVDTDGDGLADGVETGTNVFVSAADTGTNPNLADSDGDEINDGREVGEGSDPNDPASKPDLPIITILGIGTDALLGGDLTDPEDDINDIDSTGANWVSTAASSENNFSSQQAGGEAALDLFDNKVGGGEAKWCCNGPPQFVTVEFDIPVVITHFTAASANDVEARDPRDWTISGSNDGENFDVIFEQVAEANEAIWDSRNQVARIDLPVPRGPFKFIRYEVTRTGNNNHQLAELEYFGFAVSVEDIAFDPAAAYPVGGIEALVLSSAAPDTPVGTLTALDNLGEPTDATFSLVAGEGDTDNASYAIGGVEGNQLLVAGDLTGLDGVEHSVRVQADGGGGVATVERAFAFTVGLDFDADGLLDAWEIAQAGDLTTLSSEVDTDSDGLTDAEEFVLGTDPQVADSDGDTINDGDEVAAGTDPNNPDTDGDGLRDDVEDGGGVFVNAGMTGTDPLLADTDGDKVNDGDEVALDNGFMTDPNRADTDGDGFKDGIEIDNGSDPTDPNSVPDIFPVELIGSNSLSESWLTGADWDNGEEPNSAGEYFVRDGLILRSPATLVPVFGGLNLNLVGDSFLELVHNGTARIDDLRLDGGTIVQSAGGSLGLGGNINVQSDSWIELAGGSTLSLTSDVSGSARVTVIGDEGDVLELGGGGTFNGTWEVAVATLRAASANAFGGGANLHLNDGHFQAGAAVASSGVFTLQGNTTTFVLDNPVSFSRFRIIPEGGEPVDFIPGLVPAGSYTAAEVNGFIGQGIMIFSGDALLTIGGPTGPVDSDGDGISDDDEAALGTDPNDPLSTFAVRQTPAVTRGAGGVVESFGFTVPGGPGLTFNIEYKADLGDPQWTVVGTVSGGSEFTDTDAGRLGLATGYYRVTLAPTPQ